MGCGQVYRRHSRSIDCAMHACGVCKGKLVYVGKLGPDGKPLGGGKAAAAAAAGAIAAGGKSGGGGISGLAPPPPSSTPNAFASFVAERFAAVKRQVPRGTSHGEVMRRIAAEWREEKEARRRRVAAGEVGGGAAGGS